jgi:tetratricopeptide (TPR) repeat protein
MSNPKPDAKAKAAPAQTGAARKPAAATAPGRNQPAPPAEPPAPLFRRHDWLAFIITTLITLGGYLWTLSPDVTLEDSGELAVASYYAGVPHPPGYPVWTLYTWLFTVLLPFSNIAWRVAVSSAVAAALSTGVLALMVSRVSSMLIGSLDTARKLDETLHRQICVVAAIASGLLIGFNGFMWSQAVIVEVYTLSVLSLVLTLVFLLHYTYAPTQRRYLYWAAFMFGIAFTNHQTLIVAAMGIEVLITMVNRRLGRDAFLANSVFYIAGIVVMQLGGLESISSSPALSLIFHIVGIGSILTCGWLTIQTEGLGSEWLPALVCVLMFAAGAALYFYMPITSATNPPLNWGYPRTWDGFVHAFTRGQYEKTNPSLEAGRIFDQFLMLFEGAVEEFNIIYLLVALVPFLLWQRLRKSEQGWIIGLCAIYACLAFLLLWLLNPNPDRQSRELTKVFFTASHVIIAMGFGYGAAIIAALAALEYAAIRRWLMISSAVAGGIALFVVIVTFGVVELFPPEQPSYFFGIEATHDFVTRVASLLALGFAITGVALLALNPTSPNMRGLLVLIGLLPLKTILTHWSDNEQRGHLFGYWFGHDMFTPPFNDKDGKPLYPEMSRNAVLFGGTDPGRFNPTYMIFCESFIPPRCKPNNPDFDRRDVNLITQNALADGTYLNYIRAHYNRSAQIPYDTPFFQEMLRSQKEREKALYTNGLAKAVAPLDRLLFSFGDAIEKSRRAGTSWFEPDHFTDLPKLVEKLKPGPQQDPFSQHLASLLSPATRERIASGDANRRTARALAKDLNRILDQEYKSRLALQSDLNTIRASNPDPATRDAKVAERLQAYHTAPQHPYRADLVKRLPLSSEVARLVAQDVPTASRIRMGRRILEDAYPGLIQPTPGGVYPELEIRTPTPEESARCYNEYMQDAFHRKQLGQLKQGEDVREENGRVTVNGQTAVMAINALLCRVIFDNNPDHEFYIEESFPLEWMYPYLTPYGIIMKLNRKPLATLDEDTLRRDREFWSQYSDRLVGNWITDQTTVKEICDFVDKVYIQRDLRGFKGNRKFMRDDNAQKAFSKLRSSIGGVYYHRVNNSASSAEQQRMIREAEFAFRQAFAFCPYSPEAVFRYAQLLAQIGRFDDALLIATTTLRLDPFNSSVASLVEQLRVMKQSAPAYAAARQQFQQQEEEYRTNPGNLPNAMTLAQAYLDNQMHSQATNIFGRVVTSLEPSWRANPTNPVTGAYLAAAFMQLREPIRAKMVLDKLIELPDVETGTLLVAAQTYAQLNDGQRLEATLARLVQRAPDSPEAWYDYAGVLAALNKPADAVKSLAKAIELSDARRARDPKAKDLRAVIPNDSRMNPLRNLPEWRSLRL